MSSTLKFLGYPADRQTNKGKTITSWAQEIIPAEPGDSFPIQIGPSAKTSPAFHDIVPQSAVGPA